MSNFKNNKGSVQERLGRTPRFEYVNRQGETVNPKNGKPYGRSPVVNTKPKENGTKSAKRSRLPVKTRGMMFGGLDPIPTDPARDPPPRVCYNCWQPGHSRRLCPRPAIAKICNNCGRRGEDLSSCPRCCRAHKEYIARLQAKERGEMLEPSEIDQLLPGEGEEEDKGCDDVLRELIYRDEMVREQMMYREDPRMPLYTKDFEHERERQALYLQQEREREETLFLERQREKEAALYLEQERHREPLYLERDSERREPRYLERDSERREPRFLERDSERREPRYLERNSERREPLYERERDRENQERHIASLIHGREPEIDHEQDREQEGEHERDVYYEERPGKSDSAWNRLDMSSATKRSIAAASASDFEVPDDPVKEILELTKSISHLSPETQDLIMCQVMAERKEKARLRAMKLEKERQRERDPMIDAWP